MNCTYAAAHAACQQAKKKAFRLIKAENWFFFLVTSFTDRGVLYTYTCTCTYNTMPPLFFVSFPYFQTKVPVLSLMLSCRVINCFLTNSTSSSSFLTSQGGFCTHDRFHLHQQPIHEKIRHFVCRTVGVTIDLLNMEIKGGKEREGGQSARVPNLLPFLISFLPTCYISISTVASMKPILARFWPCGCREHDYL